MLLFVGDLAGEPEAFGAVYHKHLKGAKKKFGAEVYLHLCTKTAKTPVREGIDGAGHRLVDEVKAVVKKSMDLKRSLRPKTISFWGHSLGGLFVRFALKHLMDKDGKKICTLQPNLFVTTACPHLGTAGTPGPATGLGLFGRAGPQLAVEDKEALVLSMGSHRDFLTPLELFPYKAMVADVSSDLLVDFCTASLQPLPWPELEKDAVNEEYPQILHDTGAWNKPVEVIAEADEITLELATAEESSVSVGGILSAAFCSSRTGPTTRAAYYAGHARVQELEGARQNLAQRGWRLVCAGLSKDTVKDSVHNDMAYSPDCEAVSYICRILMPEPFRK